MEDDFFDLVFDARVRSYQQAFKTAVQTGTALIYEEDGDIVKFYPPYRYELVPIDQPKKTKKRKRDR